MFLQRGRVQPPLHEELSPGRMFEPEVDGFISRDRFTRSISPGHSDLAARSAPESKSNTFGLVFVSCSIQSPHARTEQNTLNTELRRSKTTGAHVGRFKSLLKVSSVRFCLQCASHSEQCAVLWHSS